MAIISLSPIRFTTTEKILDTFLEKISLKRAALCGKNVIIIIPGAVTYFLLLISQRVLTKLGC